MRFGWRGPLVGAVLTFFVLGGAGVVWLQRQINPGSGGGEVEVMVPRGLSTSGVADLLERKGVVTNATVFRYYAQVKGLGPIQAGEYRLHRRSSLSGVVATLRKGARVEQPDRLTVPEGLTMKQVADRVGQLPGRSRERFLSLARSGTVRSPLQPAGTTGMEGLLFPDTYFFS